MEIKRTLFLGLLASAAFVFKAQADEFSINLVESKKIEINGRPARMVLVTSLGSSLLVEAGAKRLGLKGTGISKLTQVQAAGQTFVAPIPIMADPLDRVPWLYRQLASLAHPILYHQFKNLYTRITTGLEGVLGWTEVRDNILVFDANQRTIRRVEQLPPETAGWLKLKVVPDRCLLLELPLADGKMGALWVDTADRRSVILPPTQWKEWTAAHSPGPLASDKVLGLPLFITTHHEARADEIKLGPLILTDVAVADMPASDEARLLQETPAAKTAWVLGMDALGRMDLIVDGKSGWAYLHPKPPAKPPYPAVKDMAQAPTATGDWTVAENVRVSSDNFFVYSGEFKWSTNNFAGALADFDRALELNPRNADAYSDRGAVREIRGDFAEAVSDYDKVIELKPDYSEWERLYGQTLLWRLARTPNEDARAGANGKKSSASVVVLEPVVVYGVRPDNKEHWAKILGQFLNGKLDEKELLAAARKSDSETTGPERKALAYYYIGMKRLSKGDKTGARGYFQKCQSAGLKDDNEYYFAVAELTRLDAAAPH
jgi:tetratricopeptide (TPR) repeat protein